MGYFQWKSDLVIQFSCKQTTSVLSKNQLPHTNQNTFSGHTCNKLYQNSDKDSIKRPRETHRSQRERESEPEREREPEREARESQRKRESQRARESQREPERDVERYRETERDKRRRVGWTSETTPR